MPGMERPSSDAPLTKQAAEVKPASRATPPQDPGGIELAMSDAIERVIMPGSPPSLGDAMRYSVFPGGARIRPRLCLAVARACGNDQPELARAAAISIEMLHCASLVHDDLPCFDDADIRRGKPAVHRAFGEPTAVLVGDALIVLAFETLSRRIEDSPARAARLLGIVSASVGMPFGIVAGQAWEEEPEAILADYQRAKTGSLFAAATEAGAVASGSDATVWRMLGERLGEAYQVADDLQDVLGSAEKLGKPTGQDASHHRPNAVKQYGVDGAVTKLKQLVRDAIDAIPPGPGAADLKAIITAESKRFMPSDLVAGA